MQTLGCNLREVVRRITRVSANRQQLPEPRPKRHRWGESQPKPRIDLALLSSKASQRAASGSHTYSGKAFEWRKVIEAQIAALTSLWSWVAESAIRHLRSSNQRIRCGARRRRSQPTTSQWARRGVGHGPLSRAALVCSIPRRWPARRFGTLLGLDDCRARTHARTHTHSPVGLCEETLGLDCRARTRTHTHTHTHTHVGKRKAVFYSDDMVVFPNDSWRTLTGSHSGSQA